MSTIETFRIRVFFSLCEDAFTLLRFNCFRYSNGGFWHSRTCCVSFILLLDFLMSLDYVLALLLCSWLSNWIIEKTGVLLSRQYYQILLSFNYFALAFEFLESVDFLSNLEKITKPLSSWSLVSSSTSSPSFSMPMRMSAASSSYCTTLDNPEGNLSLESFSLMLIAPPLLFSGFLSSHSANSI